MVERWRRGRDACKERALLDPDRQLPHQACARQLPIFIEARLASGGGSAVGFGPAFRRHSGGAGGVV